MALIADDDTVCRQFCAQALASTNYSLIQAEDAANAIRQARRTHPCLVLMDLHLPDMNACEAARQLVRGWPEARTKCRLVGMTADDSLAAQGEMYSAGFFCVLIKPFPVATLLAAARFPGHGLSRLRQDQAPSASHRLQYAFLAELPGQLAVLDTALDATDWAACRAILHRICGSAAMANLADFAGIGRQLMLHLEQPPTHSQLAQSYLDFLAGAKELQDWRAALEHSGVRHCE